MLSRHSTPETTPPKTTYPIVLRITAPPPLLSPSPPIPQNLPRIKTKPRHPNNPMQTSRSHLCTCPSLCLRRQEYTFFFLLNVVDGLCEWASGVDVDVEDLREGEKGLRGWGGGGEECK